MTEQHKNKVYIALFLILLAGAFFRFYHLSLTPYWMDEGYTINAVDSGIRNGTTKGAAILDSGKTYSCPLYCIPTSWIVEATSHDPAAYRILSVFFGLVFIVLVYFGTQKVFANIGLSILSTFFVTFSYWQIAWSRQARWYTELEVFFWSALFLFYLFLKETEKRKQYLYLAGSVILTGLAIETQRIAALLPVIFVVWYFIKYPPTKKQLSFGIPLGLVLGFAAMRFLDLEFHYTLPYYLNFYLRNYFLFLLFALYGYINLEKYCAPEKLQNTKKFFWMLIAPFVLTLAFFSFFTDVVHYRYLFHTTVALYILGSIGMINTISQIKNRRARFWSCMAIFAIFWISGHGILGTPKNDIYFLEADDPSTMNRPYYAYTPQPDFNGAYDAIQSAKKPEDIVISSHPHFNKIFLGEAGYWLRYDYLGMEDGKKNVDDGKEYYVGASVINNLDELKNITATHHGYIVYDYMAADGKIPAETIEYIKTHFHEVFFRQTNSYSQIWVYQF